MPALKSIASPENPRFVELKKLTTSHGLKKSDEYILSGSKIIKEFLRSRSKDVCEAIYLSEEAFNEWGVPGLLLPPTLFSQLDSLKTGEPLLVAKKQEFPPWDGQPLTGLNIFCPLGDPRNLGSLLRSALGFGASSVVLLKEACSPYLPEALKSAAGAHAELHLLKGPSLKELRGDFIALHMKGEPLGAFQWPKNVHLLVGEEGQGIPPATPDMSQVHLKISTDGRLESLNATIATSIALYAYREAHPL